MFADSVAHSEIPAILTFLKSSDLFLGSHLRLLSSDPAEQAQLLGIWLTIFFTNSLGEFAPGTPFTTALESNYVSNEALIMIQQLLGFNLELGSNGFMRPSVNPGIFNGSVQKCFRIVSFSADLGIPSDIVLREYQDLDTFLTGNARSANVVFIDAPDAVHDMYIANPTEIAKTITSCE
jgi:hypothetical protein